MASTHWALPENLEHVNGVLPQTAAAIGAGTYVGCRNVRKMFAVVNFTYGADVDCVISVLEADDVAGTNAQAMAGPFNLHYNTDVSLTNVWTRGTAAANYTIDTGAGKSQKVCFEIDPAKLTAGKNAIAVNVGASDVANYVSVDYYVDPREFRTSLLVD